MTIDFGNDEMGTPECPDGEHCFLTDEDGYLVCVDCGAREDAGYEPDPWEDDDDASL